MTTNNNPQPKVPYQFQTEAIAVAAVNSVLIGDECGLGKTLMAVEASRYLTPGPRLVVCPNPAKGQWRQEIIGQLPDSIVYVFGKAGRAPEDFKWEVIEAGYTVWVIIHYEALLKIGLQLAQYDWSLVVADEAHRIKNRKAKRTLHLKRIKAERKMALTGTLLEKWVGDLWSVLNWLYPKTWTSFWSFRGRYVEEKRHPFLGFMEIIGPKNLEELAGHIGPYTFRRTKEGVAPDLPPKIMTRVPIELTVQQAKLYDKIAASRDIEVDLTEVTEGELGVMVIKNTLAQIIKCQQAVVDPLLLNTSIESAKINYAVEYTMDNPDEPIIIFSRFRDTAIRLAGRLDASLLVGGVKNPTVAIAAFLTGKKRILVGTIAAMGEGLNLQRAKTAIFLDQEWSTIKMQQAVDRIHRIDIDEPKNIIYLYSEGTVDELVLQALDRKWSEAELVFRYLQIYG